LAVAALAAMLAITLRPAAVEASSSWGSPTYGDPPGWCTNHSDMWTASVVTNDPHVPANPERETFYGFHANPGYDEWYGFFYGDFRGTPNDSSGWVHLLHEDYPRHYHWNFADSGWAVHGHVKQYIAYYNWTFGGECGLGSYGSWSPQPFMADQYGYPVVDFYVDAKPPFTPEPHVDAVDESSVTFEWDPIADQGDGEGVDYFASGVDHYTSWLTVGKSKVREQLATTVRPRVITRTGITGDEAVCVHVVAVDRVHNASPDASRCARALIAPPMPRWTLPPISIRINPWPRGLTGFDSWFWLDPVPPRLSVEESDLALDYVVTATPVRVDWQFGDGASSEFRDRSGFGLPFPQPSSVSHTYQRQSRDGYEVKASIAYDINWSALVSGRIYGPYPMGGIRLETQPMTYPVEQAQPELLAT
jgi:hypothetical protein